ncbi:uncharacterized protein An04g01270 [Aspergillus niger]|uniref:Contig An04c0070, genomic contig n=2 Tax=Aspergillus niger TaxID=5061 RepID=A2QHW4_ASPNC|nr:uncharacterized protein An04g01270 [Aspergillus niger]CAK38584.1 unnamed protein product [Aspergillus niger]
MPAKNEFLCILPDKPGMMAKRLEVRPQHLEGIKPLVEAGSVVAGGTSHLPHSLFSSASPLLTSSPPRRNARQAPRRRRIHVLPRKHDDGIGGDKGGSRGTYQERHLHEEWSVGLGQGADYSGLCSFPASASLPFWQGHRHAYLFTNMWAVIVQVCRSGGIVDHLFRSCHISHFMVYMNDSVYCIAKVIVPLVIDTIGCKVGQRNNSTSLRWQHAFAL